MNDAVQEHLGLAAGWALYFRQKRRCEADGCSFAGRRLNPVLITLGTLVVVAALLLRIFPSWTASLLQSMPM